VLLGGYGTARKVVLGAAGSLDPKARILDAGGAGRADPPNDIVMTKLAGSAGHFSPHWIAFGAIKAHYLVGE
jgi:hypothetical protein